MILISRSVKIKFDDEISLFICLDLPYFEVSYDHLRPLSSSLLNSRNFRIVIRTSRILLPIDLREMKK